MAVDPSARIWCQLVPAPHSSVAVRNRQRRGGARLQGQRGINGRGPRLRSAAKQAWEAVRLCRERPLLPGARRYGSHRRRSTNDRAQMSMRRGGSGRAQSRAAHRTRPGGRWPATNFRWKSSLHSAQRLRRVQPSQEFIMGELCLPCACVPRGPHRAPTGRRHDRQSNDLSPGYWMFRRRRWKLSSDARSQYLHRQHGNRVRDGQRWLAALLVSQIRVERRLGAMGGAA